MWHPCCYIGHSYSLCQGYVGRAIFSDGYLEGPDQPMPPSLNLHDNEIAALVALLRPATSRSGAY